ncbi:hypothetical protein [Brevibacillus laterosporus]|uniref:hypothetical protein n=1 Tax=Brevibacillus laterosporus TaxID=1465 RepID=UPI000E6B6940|nr:hypothetical protein [Brevibacillus laterosporus]AYB39695.1 hypothetical protein D5F52_16240 [Brevibacillus laterosporus]MBM7109122.1 hypothetical protein [Brevibacillus laterosporus]
MSREIEVEMTLRVKVLVTDEVREAIEGEVVDDDDLAIQIVYASLNPRLSSWQVSNQTQDDYWEGIANLKGLIKEYELE